MSRRSGAGEEVSSRRGMSLPSHLAGKTMFLYVGTDKAASTWIHDVLRSHPACYIPHVKDIYFFDQFYYRGPEWYLDFFRDVQPHHRAFGELSHDYMHTPVAALRIHRDVPDARILISVREPVSRAFSSYLFMVRHGLTRRPFSEALDRFPDLIERGLYCECIRRYRKLFGEERVKVVVFDDIKERPEEVVRDLYGFLDLDPGHVPELTRKSLPAARPRNAIVAAVAKRAAVGLRKVGLTGVLGRLKSSRWIQAGLYRPYEEYPKMDEAVRRELASYFVRDIEELEELLGRSLPAWKGAVSTRPGGDRTSRSRAEPRVD